MSYNRKQLQLSNDDGKTLTIIQEADASFTSEGTMTFNVPTLKLVSSDSGVTVDDVASKLSIHDAHHTTASMQRGDLTTLTTSDQSSLVGAINALAVSEMAALAAEAETRQLQIDAVTSSIGSVSNASTSSGTTLQANIDAANGAITAEVTRATTAEGSLATLTTTEKGSLTGAINEVLVTMESVDAGLQTSLDQEILDRQNGDTTNQNSLNQEINDRSAADQTLQSAIDTEKLRIDAILNMSAEDLNSFHEIATAYASADSSLQGLITTLTSRFDSLEAVVNEALSN